MSWHKVPFFLYEFSILLSVLEAQSTAAARQAIPGRTSSGIETMVNPSPIELFLLRMSTKEPGEMWTSAYWGLRSTRSFHRSHSIGLLW